MRSENYFDEHHHLELTQAEKGVYTMVDSIQKVPAFRHTVSVLEILLVGYKDFGKLKSVSILL